MGKGNRPITCSVSSKRLRGKSWYYRDGKYFYNKRTWKTEKTKQAGEAATKAAEAKEASAKETAKAETADKPSA